jgi:hypothetical protein
MDVLLDFKHKKRLNLNADEKYAGSAGLEARIATLEAT